MREIRLLYVEARIEPFPANDPFMKTAIGRQLPVALLCDLYASRKTQAMVFCTLQRFVYASLCLYI